MATNPLIPLQGRVRDIGGVFGNALLNVQRFKDIQRQSREAPLRERILQAKAQQQEALVPTSQQRFNEDQQRTIKSLAVGARSILPSLSAGNTEETIRILEQRAERLRAADIQDNDTQEAILMAEINPEGLMQQAQQAIELDQQVNATAKGSVQFGGQQTFKDSEGNLFFGTTRRNPADGSVQSVLAPISGGAAKPVGEVSLVSGLGQTAAEKQATQIETKVAEQRQVGEVETEQAVTQAQRIEEETISARQKTALNKLKIDETKTKNENERTQLINAKNTRRSEALSAIDQINGLLKDDRFSVGFGKVATTSPDLLKSQQTLDVRAEIDQVIGLLSLESREKLKGQGTISDSETKTLEKSATVLANPLISDNLARKELTKVRGIFENSAARNQLKKETKEAQLTEEPLTPEEEAELAELEALEAGQ